MLPVNTRSACRSEHRDLQRDIDRTTGRTGQLATAWITDMMCPDETRGNRADGRRWGSRDVGGGAEGETAQRAPTAESYSSIATMKAKGKRTELRDSIAVVW